MELDPVLAAFRLVGERVIEEAFRVIGDAQ
jgi:hypothetical protein